MNKGCPLAFSLLSSSGASSGKGEVTDTGPGHPRTNCSSEPVHTEASVKTLPQRKSQMSVLPQALLS